MRGDAVRIEYGVTFFVMPRFDAASRDTDKFTRKIHFPGPRIEVRGDTVHHVRGDTVRIECGVTRTALLWWDTWAIELSV